MASVINKIKSTTAEYNIASTAYATCATAAATAAKVAYIQGETSSSGFTLVTGVTVHVKFTNANTATSPTLSINGTTAKSINCSYSQLLGETDYNYWEVGEVVTLTYDGTAWQINKSLPLHNSFMKHLEALNQQLQELESSHSQPSVLHIDMHGSGTVVTHSNIPDTVKSYSIRLYPSGASMGHAYWDNSTPNNSSPAGSGTATISSIFNWMHHRLLIVIPASDLDAMVHKNMTGLDLYFSNTSLNTTGYTATVLLEETAMVAQPITGDTSFVAFSKSSITAETNGSSSTSGYILHIEFDNEYTYNGGNLSILVRFDSTGYNSSHTTYGQINLYYH